jgi:glutamine---fructose-6-phosphate transaminase (isomerizing)
LWSIVGNGVNAIAANEIRIKLSELCYKSIAVDMTEDKKHIDLSAEPMIVVCAAGLAGATATDVVKEVAIFRAHKAATVVIASEGAEFDAAATVHVPALHPAVDFVLTTVAGHLFSYEAALAIDARARLLRSARAAVDDVMAMDRHNDDALLAAVRSAIIVPAAAILNEIQSGALNGHLEPSTAVRVASMLRYANGTLPLDSLEAETGKPTSPLSMIGELLAALTVAIDELTRPIDAVKHQAKTVTVGISRTEDTFADAWLVREVVSAGAVRDRLGYRTMRTLAALQPAVREVVGYTRYEVQGDVTEGSALLRVVDKGGVAKDITSRVDIDPRLTGTKHRAADERMVTVGRGQRDGREFVIVPESKNQQVTGITLLHVEVEPKLAAEDARSVLSGYRNRYSAIVDAVTETESHFDDEVLARVPMIDLLVDPVWVLAKHWRS